MPYVFRNTCDSNLEFKAKFFATGAHAGQKPKYTNEPYITHPENVVGLLRIVTDDGETLAAAWLHDTVEDTGATIDYIEHHFSKRIAMLVDMLTDVSTPYDGNRAQRKAVDRRHTSMGSAEAKTTKLADLIANTRSIVKYDPDFAKVYLKEKAALLGVLSEGYERLLNLAHATLAASRIELGDIK